MKKLQKRKFNNIIVTGGFGFIGSHVVKLINKSLPECNIFVLDCLTYAGDVDNISGCNDKVNVCVHDIRDRELILSFKEYLPSIDAIIHLAAESHVDRSIENPSIFMETNVQGTLNLLDLSLEYFKENPDFIFYHISTDEVFGSLELIDKSFDENTPYDPRSPYSASKAASDHFVRAYHHTYKLPILISNCSNNYGPNQYVEKLIPTVINSLIMRTDIPIYGSGENVRDWLYVEDHADAIFTILNDGRIGETYCIGGQCEMTNRDLINKIIKAYDDLNEREIGIKRDSSKLIKHLEDRKGHDLRYSIDISKINRELGWLPKMDIEQGIQNTIEYYVLKYYELIHRD